MRLRAEKDLSLIAFVAGITSRSLASFTTSFIANILDGSNLLSISIRSLMVNLSGFYSRAFAVGCNKGSCASRL